MKKLIIIVTSLVLLCGFGYGVYRVALNIASDKLIENVSTELEKSGEMAKLKKSIENDPNLKTSIENDPQLKKLIRKSSSASDSNLSLSSSLSSNSSSSASSIHTNQVTVVARKSSDTSGNNNTTNFQGKKLPFDTKEEAAKLLISRIGLSQLKTMYSKVQAGTMTKTQVLQVLRSKLTPDEITALKLVAYKEMNKKV